MSESQQDNQKKPTLPTVVERDDRRMNAAMDYLGILNPVIEQVKKDKSIREQIAECLTLNPEDLDGLSLQQIDKYLVLLPKALIWLQECENLARIACDDAQDAFDETITTQASLLPKKDFDVSQISASMRLAKVRENFPSEYQSRAKELKERKRILVRLSGQTKHLERFNDNLKKIRESHVAKIRTDKDKE